MKYPPILVSLLFLFAVPTLSAQPLTVMTYNIRLDVASDGENDWTHRKDKLAAQIQFYAPNILGIQESLPHQVSDLATRLTDYASFGIGREENGTSESATLFYKVAAFEVVIQHTFWLSATPNEVSRGWDAACNRVCTYALFKDKKSKKQFWVFNTHLDHIGATARIKGIKLILSQINALNAKGYPVVFMGDLNSEPDSEVIATLNTAMNDTRNLSVEKAFGPSGTFNAFRFDLPVTKLIDYIYVSKDAKVTVQKHAILSDSIDMRYMSDHLPVFVALNFL